MIAKTINHAFSNRERERASRRFYLIDRLVNNSHILCRFIIAFNRRLVSFIARFVAIVNNLRFILSINICDLKISSVFNNRFNPMFLVWFRANNSFLIPPIKYFI
jgi:hypothetical protein